MLAVCTYSKRALFLAFGGLGSEVSAGLIVNLVAFVDDDVGNRAVPRSDSPLRDEPHTHIGNVNPHDSEGPDSTAACR